MYLAVIASVIALCNFLPEILDNFQSPIIMQNDDHIWLKAKGGIWVGPFVASSLLGL